MIANVPGEPPPDPATAPIIPGKESQIDITTDGKPLGINVVGGQDTLLPVNIQEYHY